MKRIWCDEDFHKKIKKSASEQGISILKFTKKVANEANFFKNGEKIAWKKKEQPKFKFDF